MKTLDGSGNKQEARFFLRESGLSILMFHEYPGAVREILAFNKTLKDILLVLSFSWHVSEIKAVELSDYFHGLAIEFPAESDNIRNNVILTMNSISETERLRHVLPNHRVAHVNNTCFLSERQFNIYPRPRTFAAVMNAKPLLFKRHYLATAVKDLLLVTYSEAAASKSPDYFDLARITGAEIRRDVREDGIPILLNESICGLALSEIEGACYASTEYLLCGIPVVSTISLGGRDDYYTSNNSTIVEPTRDAVQLAVTQWVERTTSMRVDRDAIRSGAIDTAIVFRKRLCDEMASATRWSSDYFFEALKQKIDTSNKLWSYKNFWSCAVVDD